MTITEILEQVRTRKACSVSQLKRYMKKFNIQPNACRQRPQIYSDDSATRILAGLGLAQPPAAPTSAKNGRVVSLEKLQTFRTGGKATK